MSIVRHYFPGNNTPKGFFSYYSYILGQREANKIICIKGGPGTGKSTFLKRVGTILEHQGVDIDYLHCSADANSLDGILLPEKKIAFIDGTSPHIIDPITPGAVDEIVNFGEFWNDEEINKEKDKIITYNEECSHWYKFAYNYLQAAKSVSNSLSMIREEGIDVSEVYKLASDIIFHEYKQFDISINAGKVKKFFATGITPSGCENMIHSLLHSMRSVYLIDSPVGYQNQSFMRVMLDGAVYRGFDVEAYYCPMNPEHKIEHLIIPELGLAFVTTNCWHDVEPWELMEDESELKEITLIDICDFQSACHVEKHQELITELEKMYADLIRKAINCLSKAKEYHDYVEKYYIQNMSFEKVDELVELTIKDILKS